MMGPAMTGRLLERGHGEIDTSGLYALYGEDPV
jgi:hypothetical protein